MGIHTTAGLQCSSALPSHLAGWKEDGALEEMGVPSDPCILNQIGASLPWDRMVCSSMRELKTGKERFSLPGGFWTLNAFLLISLKVGQVEQHHIDACLPELLPCCQLGQKLHDSQTFPKTPSFLLKGAAAWLDNLYVPLPRPPRCVLPVSSARKGEL